MLHILSDRILGYKGVELAAFVQAEASERRFAASTTVLARPGRVEALKDAQIQHSPGIGSVVHATGNEPTVELPAIPRSQQLLPILRIALHSPVKTTATLTWQSTVPSPQKQQVHAELQPGANTLHFPLLDPAMHGPLKLRLGTQAGDYTIGAMEVRGHPR